MASYEKGKYSYNGNTIYYDEAETLLMLLLNV